MGTILVSATLAFFPFALIAQSTDYSTQILQTSEGPTNVLVIGLDERQPGQPVLVVQSGGGTALKGAWAGWVSGLGAIAPVVAFDRPGIGQSPYAGISLEPDGMTRHTSAVLNAIDASPPYVLVGHSWGAELIGRFATTRPQDVSGLVFLDPTPRFSAEFMTAEGVTPEDRAALVDSLRAVAIVARAEGRAAEVEVSRYVLTGTGPDDIPVLPDLPVPMAVLLAASPASPGASQDFEDRFTALKVAYFSEAVQGRFKATLVIDTSIGHRVYLGDPELATEVVRRVVEDATAERAR